MKLIIAGSRNLVIHPDLLEALFIQFELPVGGWNCEYVSGGARGIDQLGEAWGEKNKVKAVKFPADWDTHGKAAGPIRNKQMAEYADALLLIWDGESKGSANMKMNMEKLGKPIYEVIIKGG